MAAAAAIARRALPAPAATVACCRFAARPPAPLRTQSPPCGSKRAAGKQRDVSKVFGIASCRRTRKIGRQTNNDHSHLPRRRLPAAAAAAAAPLLPFRLAPRAASAAAAAAGPALPGPAAAPAAGLLPLLLGPGASSSLPSSSAAAAGKRWRVEKRVESGLQQRPITAQCIPCIAHPRCRSPPRCRRRHSPPGLRRRRWGRTRGPPPLGTPPPLPPVATAKERYGT